jgi:hypothetical protein
LVRTRNIPVDTRLRAEFVENYRVDEMRVAEAFLARIEKLADERAQLRRSLMYSVEMVEAGDFNSAAV